MMYKLKLTNDEVSALCFISDRYRWAGLLYANIVQPEQEVQFKEHDVWKWMELVDEDYSKFPLASPDFANKLQKFYDSII